MLGLREPEASQPGEIVLKGADWYDYAAKYDPGGMELRRAGADPRGRARARCAGWRVETFVRVGLRRAGAGRLLRRGRPRARQRAQHDARLHADERLPEAVGGESGLAFPELCDRLLEIARERFRVERGGHAF